MCVFALTTYENFVVDYDYKNEETRIIEYVGNDASVVIPDRIGNYNVKVIDERAFVNNKTVENVTFSFLMENIRSYAFFGCTSLKTFDAPYFLTNLGNYAFYGCTSLTDVTFKNNINYINQGTFANCTSLKNVTLSESINYIKEDAFSGCTSLSQIVIPESVKSIDKTAFNSCSPNFTIIAPKGSYAETYAIENNIKYERPPIKYGDVDDDTRITIKDVTYLQKALAFVDDIEILEGTDTFIRADVNGDGVIDVRDGVLIQKYVIHNISTFPVEENV